jgi:penicillin-binding protein 1B
MVLARGARPDADLVEEHLRRLGYRHAEGRQVGIGEYYLGRRTWVIGRRPFRPASELVTEGFIVGRMDSSGRITRLEDDQGVRFAQAQLEPELLGRFGEGEREDRLYVPLAQMPDHLVQAVLAVEDQRFFEHHGLDFRRIVAAALANLKVGQVVQGGSTLTQQLTKNLFLFPKRSFVRKVREASMAVVLEARHTKAEILEAYLGEVYLGQNGGSGVHGMASAARYFFGKDVSALDLSESALLAGLIRAPNAYSPYRQPDVATERRNLVLRVMERTGAISAEESQRASDAPIRLRERPQPIRSARYFLDFVARDLEDPQVGGALVTTLDPNLQRAAESAVDAGLARLERDFEWLRESERGEPLQAALVALDPHTGEVLAMVGGRDYGQSQFNRAVDARRQPGSAFKPVVALSALSRRGTDTDGPVFTLASRLDDEPLRVETPVGLWEPANYDGRFSGSVTLRDALERSLNVPFARLGLRVGGEQIVETAKKLGIDSPLNPYPSLALGASEVSPLELTRAYGVLAAGGFRAGLTTTLASIGGQGQALPQAGHVGARVYDPAETYLVTSALLGAVERGTGRALRDRGFHGDVAAKSGTTNDFRDGWFVGYTPNLVVGVWVGFDHGDRLEIPGAGAALPIFSRFLEEAVGPDGASGPWGSDGFAVPSGLERARVAEDSGRRGRWSCSGEPELFLRGTAPEDRCWGGFFDRRSLERVLDRGGAEARQLLRLLLDRFGRDRSREPGAGGR